MYTADKHCVGIVIRAATKLAEDIIQSSRKGSHSLEMVIFLKVKFMPECWTQD